jgi:cardiolipin synthase A/B
VRALLERAYAGVTCRVVVDPIGSDGFEEEVLERLRDGGCDVRLFRRVGRHRVIDRLERNHRKLLIVDGEVGFTGGFAIRDLWRGEGRGPECWRDTHVCVRGPAVRQMQVAFSDSWREAGGGLLPGNQFPPLPEEGPARAAFVASGGEMGHTVADRLCNLAIAVARRRLWIASSYFVPSETMRRLLIARARAGVDVRVLVPGPIHDVHLARAAQRASYPGLLDAGVRIWEYQPSMMHAKTMLIDERLSLVGSINLDPLSLRLLEEGSLIADDAELARALEHGFLEDLALSRERRPRRLLLRRVRRAARSVIDWLH